MDKEESDILYPGAPEIATGVFIRIDTRMIKHFLDQVPAKQKFEVTVDFDGLTKNFTLQEFKYLLFPELKELDRPKTG